MNLPISVVILTYNEEKNIAICLDSIKDFAQNIFIVDSFSTDETLEIAKRYTDKIFQHTFETQAKQFNWGLDNLPINTEWVMRLDADEVLSLELKDELQNKLNTFSSDTRGLYVKRRVYFLGKWMRFGGYYPIWLLRIWRKGMARSEELIMDEHIKLIKGKSCYLTNDIFEENKKDINWWIQKHNDYATREAISLLNLKYSLFKNDTLKSNILGTQEQKKRWIKEEVYNKMPMFFRTLCYFLYRYFLRLGFLDGKEGLIWHFLQGFWYRFLVDAKIYEIQSKARKENKNLLTTIHELYDIAL